MTDHEGESLIDKVKNAFGMGADDDESATGTMDDSAGTATIDDPGGTANRSTGPDFGADQTLDSDFGAGLDREGMAGTGGSNTGTGLGYDFQEGAVTDPGMTDRSATGVGGGAGVGESEWTREGAASGEPGVGGTGFGTEESGVGGQSGYETGESGMGGQSGYETGQSGVGGESGYDTGQTGFGTDDDESLTTRREPGL